MRVVRRRGHDGPMSTHRLARSDLARAPGSARVRVGSSPETRRYDLPGMTLRDGIHEGAGGKAAWFKDTEGNILALIQDGK
jgi:hypothetical protein